MHFPGVGKITDLLIIFIMCQINRLDLFLHYPRHRAIWNTYIQTEDILDGLGQHPFFNRCLVQLNGLDNVLRNVYYCDDPPTNPSTLEVAS